MVAQAQEILTDLGYKPGRADGIAGPQTKEAIRAYQAEIGGTPDGRVSQDLLAHLEASLRGDVVVLGSRDANVGTPPDYRLGTTFVYSDGRIETVIRRDRDTVRWRTNRGTIFTAHRNFVLPRTSWFSAGQSGKRTLDAAPEALWPLKVGKTVSFTAESIVRHGERPDNVDRASEKWRCAVEGVERVAVVAGTFQAWKVACRRTIEDASPQLTRVWYYAPAIGHYVRVNDFYDAEALDRHVELVAVQPGGRGWPPAARAGLSWALEHALETMTSGEQITWSSSAVDSRVTIQAMPPYERGDRKKCRNFLQIWSDQGRHLRYPGAACREASGRWRIPGLERGEGVTLAISNELS